MGRHVIVGAGRSGLAVARHLAKSGVEALLTDARAEPDESSRRVLESLGVPAVWGAHPEGLLEGAEALVLSPGVSPSIPFARAARDRGIPVLGELELAHRALRAKDPGARILAVTGTNGKSTTTDLLGHLLRAGGLPSAACGNLGTPLLEAQETAAPGTVYALECSSYQLETVSTFHAEGAALLNLTPDHLARHGTLEAYLAAKQRIFLNQGPEDLQVHPEGHPELAAGAPGQGRTATFGWTGPGGAGSWCDGEGRLRLRAADGAEVDLLHRSELRIPGNHNVENALAAVLLASHAGVSVASMREGLRTYPGLAHRIAFCGERDGVKAYNDSKGTNVDATLTAIHALPGPLVLLLGGTDKGASYAPLIEALTGKLRRLVFLGEAIPQLQRDLGGLPHDVVPAFDDAVRHALALAEPGDQVLLSPACASFDQFRNFEERGERFEGLVRAWAAS
ncbi:MAG: UDP-N-acetylmuramoyl-L-alanine--D-glutamate ligase [Holophagaceae bacterium]